MEGKGGEGERVKGRGGEKNKEKRGGGGRYGVKNKEKREAIEGCNTKANMRGELNDMF